MTDADISPLSIELLCHGYDTLGHEVRDVGTLGYELSHLRATHIIQSSVDEVHGGWQSSWIDAPSRAWIY